VRTSAIVGPKPAVTGAHDLWRGFWRLADPKISLASMASIFLGTCVAAVHGPLRIDWLIVTVVGIFAIEVAKNASGEIVDFDSGADRGVAPEDASPFSGGKRVLVDGILTRGETLGISALSYLIGIVTGLAIAAAREPRVLWLGVIGIACAFFYHAPPFRLSYRGLGEFVVALCYGPLIATGAYLVQRGHVSADVLLLSLPLGLLIGAFLWINEFPDYAADRAAGKRTLVVQIGRPRASRLFAMIVAGAFVWLAALPLAGVRPTVLLGLAGAIPGSLAAIRLWKSPESTPELIPAQAQTLLAFVLVALGAGIGMQLG
jgi:1,4-dihydroxy-2-naphthoate octaprenyltransferase